MKVSVIIPTYNRLTTLPRAVDSVMAQTWADWDLWIVDDGSTDGTQDWVKSHLADDLETGRVQFLRIENGGVSRARNLGVKNSDGQWLAFLDSDDEWLSDKLEKQITWAQRNPNFPLIHGEEIWIRHGVRVNPMKKHQKTGGRIFENCLPLCCISPSTAMIRREVFAEVGMFREDFPVCEDYDMWLKICSRYDVGFIETPLIIKYGGHEDQLSRQYHSMDFWRLMALEPYLNSALITRRERKLVAEMIYTKSEILLRGYRKHNNMENYSIVVSLQQKAHQMMNLENSITPNELT